VEKKLHPSSPSDYGCNDDTADRHMTVMDVQLSIPTDHSHRISSNDFPQSDVLKNTDRKKILHYRQFYVDLPDPIVLFPVVVNTSGHLHDDFQESSFVN
jgi:hypothetical protein